MTRDTFERAAEVTRGDLVESVHAAAIAVTAPDGTLVASLGDPDLLIYLRSAAKPFQAASALASGAGERFGFSEREIALMAGSHAGETTHVAVAASMLVRAGIPHEALGCGIHPPFHRPTAERLLRDGEKPTAVMNNCSGKHAGMLAAARALGLPLERYLDPGHPVQRANLEAVARFTGREASRIRVSVDGCGAPTFAVSLREAARGFSRLVAAGGEDSGEALERAAARVARAMRAHPDMVAGDGMLDTALMRAVPGLVAKVGADGVHAMAWPGPPAPVGIALKLMDGDVGRGRTAVVLGVLGELGLLPGDPPLLPESIVSLLTVRTLGGVPVGRVRPVFSLRRPL